MNISKNIHYVGVNDKKIDLFESIYTVPNGVSYNSYVITDEKIAVLDTVEASFGEEWLLNLERVLADKSPDYLIIQHVEPDHSANIKSFLEKYPDTTLVASAKAFEFIKNFFGVDPGESKLTVADGSTLSLGEHNLRFVTAPMVHWPEVIMTFDETTGVFFSADAFGKFGALDIDEDWVDEARRYYIGIVGKYGAQVRGVLKKAAALDIKTICPLHGPVLSENLGCYLEKYEKWASYTPEENGTVIVYTSVYGNTKAAALRLYDELISLGETVTVYDLARCDSSFPLADAFRFSKLVIASPTYNGDVFPPVKAFINLLTSRNYSSRLVGIIENGSWAPMSAKVTRALLSESKDLIFAENTVTVRSSVSEDALAKLSALAKELGNYKA